MRGYLEKMDRKWDYVKKKCPLDVNTIIDYDDEFQSYVNIQIYEEDGMENAKKMLIEAKGKLECMINGLLTVLNEKTLKQGHDVFLFEMLCDNLSRFLKILDEKEEFIGNRDAHNLTIIPLSTFKTTLITSSTILVYEPLYQSTKIYEGIEGEKDLNTFFYILYEKIRNTLNVFGGMERIGNKKSKIMTSSTPYKLLMSNAGKKSVIKEYAQHTGRKEEDIEKDLELLNEEEFDDEFEDEDNEDN